MLKMKKSLEIRHFILGEILRAGTSSVKLDSVRGMAKRFDAAQCTVSSVMAELIRDQWLVPRKGIGVFTNPLRLAPYAKKGLIGFINGDGKLFYYDKETFNAFSETGHEAIARGFHFKNIMLEGGNADEVADEVASGSYTSVVWCAGEGIIPKGIASKLRKKGVRFVCDFPDRDVSRAVLHDETPVYAMWQKYCKKHKMKHILLALTERREKRFLEFFKENPPEMKVETKTSAWKKKQFDLILTDEYRNAVFEGTEKSFLWNIDPERSDRVYLPDWKQFARKALDLLNEENGIERIPLKIHKKREMYDETERKSNCI